MHTRTILEPTHPPYLPAEYVKLALGHAELEWVLFDLWRQSESEMREAMRHTLFLCKKRTCAVDFFATSPGIERVFFFFPVIPQMWQKKKQI